MNKVKIIKLANNTLIINLSTGPRYLTNEHFGYAEICKNTSFTEEQVLDIIKVPPLPNGVFNFYMRSPTEWAILNVTNDGQHLVDQRSTSSLLMDYLMGVFASVDAIKQCYPECFI